MTEDQIKTMVGMAKAIDEIRAELKGMKQGTIIVPSMPQLPTFKEVPRLEHRLESETQSTFMQVDVQFQGGERMTFEMRQHKCETFLRELGDLLKDYDVISASIKYGPRVG